MGQKVSPLALRLGFIKNWNSLWFAKPHDYANFLEEDYKIRRYIKEKFKQAAVSKIVIERLAEKVKVKIYTARPGVIIGRHRADVEKLSDKIKDITKNKEVSIDIKEIKDPFADAQLIAENIAFQLEKRVAFKRAIKRAIEQSKAVGVKGIKISCSGRLGGAEIARRETYKFGKLPLQTFRADIDYGFAEALTTYGLIGVKAWLYKGDALLEKPQPSEAEEQSREIRNAVNA
ncbi:MAG: 30S ribosomal protein S3 [Candidatus Omnitrophica bacterium]|nr:30S ribosomal protein S3 [Candidatus Omnitrophota bacterium]MDD5352207.1 30S ribosomal protein S3 [Candidatus Omnitrophota bacterium]MDD5549805.1 30S ribosomal protein S3 [Candidatus Omnitrophota bacterium]